MYLWSIEQSWWCALPDCKKESESVERKYICLPLGIVICQVSNKEHLVYISAAGKRQLFPSRKNKGQDGCVRTSCACVWILVFLNFRCFWEQIWKSQRGFYLSATNPNSDWVLPAVPSGLSERTPAWILTY